MAAAIQVPIFVLTLYVALRQMVALSFLRCYLSPCYLSPDILSADLHPDQNPNKRSKMVKVGING